MRCVHCNVDLSETYTKCPLCGEKAQNEQPKLTGLKNAPYPHNVPVEVKKVKKEKTGFCIEKIKAFFNL